MLAQKTSREAEAKRKVVEKGANRGSRLREKEERQWQVQQRGQVQEANIEREWERLEVEKRAAGMTRRRRGSCNQAIEAMTPRQQQPTPTMAPQLRTSSPVVEVATPPIDPTNVENT